MYSFTLFLLHELYPFADAIRTLTGTVTIEAPVINAAGKYDAIRTLTGTISLSIITGVKDLQREKPLLL